MYWDHMKSLVNDVSVELGGTYFFIVIKIYFQIKNEYSEYLIL